MKISTSKKTVCVDARVHIVMALESERVASSTLRHFYSQEGHGIHFIGG